MTPGTIVVLLILTIICGLIIRNMVKKAKAGGDPFCSCGNCGGACSGHCGSCKKECSGKQA